MQGSVDGDVSWKTLFNAAITSPFPHGEAYIGVPALKTLLSLYMIRQKKTEIIEIPVPIRVLSRLEMLKEEV